MIFTAIGTAIAGALFGGSLLAASLIAGGLAFAAKLGITNYMNRRKARKYSAVQGEVQYGADVAATTLYGIGKTRGHRVFYGKWGSGNKYNADVYMLANGWCDGLEPYVFFYGQRYNLVERPKIGGEAAHYGVTGFGDLISIRFYDGRPGQPVDQKLVNDTVGLGRSWKQSSVGAGYTYVVFERKYDSDKFEKGRIEIEWVLRGLRCYDVRKDSTIAGGSGSHRLDNPATWEFTLNPAVQRMNYQIGLRGLVSGRTLIGEGKSIGQLDLATYLASMNVCDEQRGGKPRYSCNIWVNGDDDHTEILKEFEDAMAGFAVNRRGLSGVIAGAPQVPVINIGPDDLPAERESEISYRKSAFDLYNMMSGQFTSPDSNWGTESLKPIVVNADVAADGRRRQTSYDFLQVTDADTAQYLLNIRYRQQRLGGKVTLPVSWRIGTFAQEGDWVTFDGHTWMVEEWRCSDDFRFTLVLSETAGSIYSEDGIEPGPIVIPPVDPINPSLLSTVQNFNIEVGSIKGADGYEQPALRFTWKPPEDPTITAVRFFYRIADEDQDFQDQCTDPEAGVYVTTKDVQSGRFYQGRATITTVPDRFKSFTPWKTTVSPTGMQSVVIELEQTRGALKEALKSITSLYDQVDDLVEQLAAATAVGTGQNILTSAAIVKTTNGLAASFIEQAAKIEEVEGKVEATASLIAGVQAQVDDVSASGLISMKGVTNPSNGVYSQVTISAKASKSVQEALAAMILRVVERNGRLVSENMHIADRTIFVSEDGGTVGIPIVIENGELKLRVGRIDTAYFNQLQSTNGKLILRGYGDLSDIRMFR
ncbi:phage tail tip fiber protein [Brucella anthropi]|uniref:phage tail tip fiber protein n=1 Tax=Brucella anthropi TaxID=529 RepID=UPI0021663396|nr:phage tail protein [Brucella anthropi]UVV66515.1 phage tail protein [Brucella anthropi]